MSEYKDYEKTESFEETSKAKLSIVNDAIEETDDEADDLYIKFNKPYVFEEETYEGIDLSGLEDLTAKDLTDIEKKFFKTGVSSFTPELSSTYARITAQKATGFPIEFFDQLPIKEMTKIKNAVIGFFYN